jgi:hypothetical protein
MSRTSARLGIAVTGLVLISTALPGTAQASSAQTTHSTAANSMAANSMARHSMAAHSAEPVALPTGFRPEGVTSGPGDTYYTDSLADGRIWTGDLSRGTGRQLLAGVTGRSLRGMQWDPRSGLL